MFVFQPQFCKQNFINFKFFIKRIARSAIILEINTKDVKLLKTNISSLRSKRHLQSISYYDLYKVFLTKYLERKDKILVFTNFTSLVLISTMIALLVILFIIKLYARNNTFKFFASFKPRFYTDSSFFLFSLYLFFSEISAIISAAAACS